MLLLLLLRLRLLAGWRRGCLGAQAGGDDERGRGKAKGGHEHGRLVMVLLLVVFAALLLLLLGQGRPGHRPGHRGLLGGAQPGSEDVPGVLLGSGGGTRRTLRGSAQHLRRACEGRRCCQSEV